MIRPATTKDAGGICAIYNHHVLSTSVTFEEVAVTEAEMAKRIVETSSNYPWLVWEESGRVIGYAYATAWKSRCAYRFSAETTVYVALDSKGLGIGTRLYESLLADLRSKSIHSVIGGIALPNEASIALHEKLGFEKVAHFKQVGWKLERWIDVGYWELIL